MIGLAFLAVGLIWLAFSAYLSFKIPRWLGIKHAVGQLAIGLTLLAVFLIGPFLDEIVGMRQFDALCREHTAPIISNKAQLVKSASASDSSFVKLSGYVISIYSSKITYIDNSTGEIFLEFNYFKTRGGLVAGFALMGGVHSCSAERGRYSNQLNDIPAYKNLVIGGKS